MIVEFVTENGRTLKLAPLTFNQLARVAREKRRTDGNVFVAVEAARRVLSESLTNGGLATDPVTAGDLFTRDDVIRALGEIARISTPAKPKRKFFGRF